MIVYEYFQLYLSMKYLVDWNHVSDWNGECFSQDYEFLDFVHHLVFWKNTMFQKPDVSIPRWEGGEALNSVGSVRKS
jgi:hypothetical protein